jgi:two-component system, LytTR family, sensor kinase
MLFTLLQWSGWLIFGALSFAWTVSSWGLFGALLNNAIFVVTGGLLTLSLRRIYRRVRQIGMSYSVIAPCVLVACALLAELWYAAELLIDRISFDFLTTWEYTAAYFAFGARQFTVLSYLVTFGQWLVYVFTLLTWSSLYFGINSILELEYERTRATQALRLADSAQLKVLQAQLNPHFIFNALNGVTTLIRENRGDAAARMVSTLSELLRATLRTINRPEHTVSEELVFVDQYIELQQLRFADRLQFHIDVDEETFAALLPTLIVQPLVENAVLHGALSQGHGGAVRISIRRSGEHLQIAIEDNGAGVDHSGTPTYGIGLTNTAERLQMLYGEAGQLSIDQPEAGGFAVTLRLPFREASVRTAVRGDGA